jgi:F-type H+-transporting ATPase subunit b
MQLPTELLSAEWAGSFGPREVLFAAGAVNVDLDLTMLVHLVLFTAFVVLMKDLVFDPLLRVFEEREKRTAGAIDKARAMDEQAIVLKQEHDSRLEEIRREAAVDRERIRARLKKLENEMLSSAREAVELRLEAGKHKIAGEVEDIQRDLDRQRSALSAEIASRVLGREVQREVLE